MTPCLSVTEKPTLIQLPLFEEKHDPDPDALARCLAAPVVAIDIETETRWPGEGPRLDYGLSYPAPITVIALAWPEGDTLQTTALAKPFDEGVRGFLWTLFTSDKWIVAHNAVFDLRQLSKLTDGLIPRRIWDTQSMARLLSPSVQASYNLIAVARSLRIPVLDRQQTMKSQRGRLHLLPLDLTLEYAQDDARLALQIWQRQQQLPQDAELVDWECRAVYEYCLMAARGIRLNRPFVDTRLTQLRQERDTLAARLRADGMHAPGSSKARAQYLYQSGVRAHTSSPGPDAAACRRNLTHRSNSPTSAPALTCWRRTWTRAAPTSMRCAIWLHISKSTG